ncbi:Rhophilin, Rho GTPase binding protein [Sparganum proliferum]
MSFLSVPTKKGSEVELVKPIEHYIKGNYGAGPATACSKGLSHLQKVRANILTKLNDKHESTVTYIEEYVDTLMNLEQRIPMTNQEVAIPFKWYDCFCSQSLFSRDSMKGYAAGFERCCMIFNLAAVHSQIAASQNTRDDEGLRTAAKSFQAAAGMFEYVKVNLPSFYSQSPTWDMCSESLAAFSSVMLAQAQEAIFIKAEQDDMKAGVVAKIANQAAALYNDALKNVSLSSLRAYMPKEWPSTLSFKASLMETYAEYYRGVAAGEEQKYGEQIARFSRASHLLKNLTSRSTRDSVKQFSEKVKNAHNTAKKDNDLIYHDTVPDPKSLPTIGVAVVAKKTPLQLPLSGKVPKDRFSSLVPMAVHSALTAAEAVRQQMISVEIGRLREASDVCNSTLASLNLPAAVQDTEKEEAPSDLLAKAAQVRSAGGLKALADLASSLADGSMRNKEILDNIISTVDEEEKTDNDLRKQYGDKWNRAPSNKLNASWRQEIAKHKALLEQASITDKALIDRYHANENDFKKLCQSDEEIKDLIRNSDEPSSPSSPTGSKGREKLRELCRDIETMKDERKELQQQLQALKLPDELRDEFLKLHNKGAEINATVLATDHLNGTMEPVRDCVRESLNRQESLLKKIQSTYESTFGKTKAKATIGTTLLMSAEAYNQLTQDFTQGVNFYADLTNILVKFQNKVNDFSFARKTEKKELMKDIASELSAAKTEDSVPALPARPPPTYLQTANPPASAPAAQPAAPPAAPQAAHAAQPHMAMPPQYPYWPGYGMAPMPPMGQMPPLPAYGAYGYPMPGMPMYYPPPTQPTAPGSQHPHT